MADCERIEVLPREGRWLVLHSDGSAQQFPTFEEAKVFVTALCSGPMPCVVLIYNERGEVRQVLEHPDRRVRERRVADRRGSPESDDSPDRAA